jgi:hypothetical protein
MHKKTLLPIILMPLLLTACLEDGPLAPAPKFNPVASLQEIMVDIIDPNIDFVWNSVATISTSNGLEERKPVTDEEWKIVRQHALTVLEAGNLLLVEDRPVAKPGASTSLHPVELSPADIQIAIASHPDDFAQRVHALQAAVQLSLAAIDAKNVDELEKAGGAIDQACEQCHTQFWYPNDKRPK